MQAGDVFRPRLCSAINRVAGARWPIFGAEIKNRRCWAMYAHGDFLPDIMRRKSGAIAGNVAANGICRRRRVAAGACFELQLGGIGVSSAGVAFHARAERE